MTAERWVHIRSVFESAQALEGAARIAYLEEACGSDAALREEVESLLDAAEDPTPFLEDSLHLDAMFTRMDDRVEGQAGTYRLHEEIGRGGMGAVYLAERIGDAFTKPVAVKLLERQSLASRFEQEQQILRHLNHPGIARLLDVGYAIDPLAGAKGRPFLVMDYVEGQAVDQFCINQHISIEDRLHIFLQICSAVQYAHENLVLHRDIKPSNILVDRSDTGFRVKLLDFGIAKLLDTSVEDEAPITRAGQQLLTPEFASPEQLKFEPVNTSSDVYALGVLLFLLMTDRRPYDLKGRSLREIEAVVCETMPPKPSSVVAGDVKRRLKGDLDTIMLKALQKEPERRYRTVVELSDDVQRFLAHLPVKARPDSAGYRFLKFARRRRAGLAVTFIIALTLLGGVFATALQSRITQRRSEQIRLLSATLLSEIDLAIRDLPGATKARERLVATAVQFLDSLYQDAPQNQTLQLEMAGAYDKLARLQGDPHYSNLGWLSEAKKSYYKAYGIRQALWQEDSSSHVLTHALAVSFGHIGVMESWTGSNEEAIRLSREALRLLAKIEDRPAEDIDYAFDVARIQSELGWWQVWSGYMDDGLETLRDVTGSLEALARANPDHIDVQLQLWRNYWYQVDGLKFTYRDEEAMALLEQKARPFLETLYGRFETNPRVQYSMHTLNYFVGELLLRGKDYEGAKRAFENSIAFAEHMVASDSTNRKGREGQVFGYGALGRMHFAKGEYTASIPYFRQNVALQQQLYEQDTGNLEAANGVSSSHRILCRALYQAGDLRSAVEHCVTAIEVMEPVVAGTKVEGVPWGNQGFNYGWLARIYVGLAGNESTEEVRDSYLARALDCYDRSIAIMSKIIAQLDGNDGAWEFPFASLQEERDAVVRRLK